MISSAHPRRVRLITAASIALVVMAGGVMGASGHEQARSRGLAGTWRVEVTLYDCNSGVERPPFWSLLTFGDDETMAETTSNQALPGTRTPGHGVWGRTGARDYRAVSEAFILFGPAYRPWTQRISQDITVHSSDQFTSQASVEFEYTPGTLPAGPVALPPAPGCARANGYRF